MSPLASYRRLFRLVGPLYVVIAFLGRLPAAMSQMGTLLLVSDATGSYAAGGTAAGALAVANAVCSPVAGAVADGRGQRPVVLAQSVGGALGLLALVAVAAGGGSGGALALVAAAAGAFIPQVGPLARVRWRPLTRTAGRDQGRLVETAFSYEGAADEASFVLGPALLGLVIAIASPGTALTLAAGLLVVFGTAFALHPTARLAHAHRPVAAHTGRLLTASLAVLLVAQSLVGAVFGSVQTGTSALATAAGQPGLAGLVHAVLGVGSVVAALAMAAVPERVPVAVRSLASACLLLLLASPLLLVDGVLPLVGVVLLLGVAVGPFMISNFVLAERAADPSRVAAAMTLMAGATGIGYAVGSGTAGRLADSSGHTAAFAVTVTAAGLAVLVALVAQPALRRLTRHRAGHDGLTHDGGTQHGVTQQPGSVAHESVRNAQTD